MCEKSTFRTKNDTRKANFRCMADKKKLLIQRKFFLIRIKCFLIRQATFEVFEFYFSSIRCFTKNLKNV